MNSTEFTSNIHIDCPFCEAEYDYVAHHVVDKSKSLDMMMDIVTDDFFYAVCPSCHRMLNVDHPVVYTDMDNNALIAYFDSDIELALAHGQISEWAKDLNVNVNESIVRVVSSQNELREKVILVENGLDDRIIEVLKLWALEKVRSEGHNQPFEEVRCGVMGDGSLNIDFVGDEPMHIGLRKSYYDRVEHELMPILNRIDTPLEVSTDWAIDFDSGYSK